VNESIAAARTAWNCGRTIPDVNLQALLCVPFGHHWEAASEVHQAFPMLTCKRCGQAHELHEGSRDAKAARLDTHHAYRDSLHCYGILGRPKDWIE
jgi:hypothetical protein